MRFSVVVPTLNAGTFLTECLDSILLQGRGMGVTEIIVVDGGSTDATLDIVNSYHYHTVRLLTRPPKGETNAINEGLRAATGDIVSWLDADDRYELGAFDAVEQSMVGAMWVYGKCRIIDKHGKCVRQPVTRFKELLQPKYSYRALQTVCFVPQPATFWRRELLAECGYLDEAEKYVMDYEYWLRIGKCHHPAYCDKYIASWRSHPGSVTATGLMQNIRDARRVARKYGGGMGADATFIATVAGYKLMGAL